MLNLTVRTLELVTNVTHDSVEHALQGKKEREEVIRKLLSQ